ncbi:MAG TPA: primosomal protein N' [Cyclobacteriaceae bacterium]|nr:primosomal protein N' [Cyclobacteriaceae bacterium]
MSALFTDETVTRFVEIILPVPIPKLFTYRVPVALADKVRSGQRVIVPFGPKKILTGVIVNVHETPPRDYEAKYILEILEETEVIGDQQFKLYNWMASYYMCTPGEVLNAALPAGLKLSSESMIQLHPSFDDETTRFDFSEKERLLLHRLKQGTLNYTEAAKILGVKTIYSLLKSLSSKEAIILYEEVKDKYKPKTEKRVRLVPKYTKKKDLEKLFETIASKPKQEAVLLKYLQDIPVFSHPELNKKGVARNILLDNEISESSLHTLVKNKVLEEFEVVVPRFKPMEGQHAAPVLLTEKQEEVRNKIITGFEEKGTVLLYGVTGSGKTEIYIDLIRRALEGGSQVLYLLPEIALTTQIVERMKKVFGDEMGIYHSRFSDAERVEVWNGVLQGKFRFVVGVRSSIFLPFDDLGLIIVDEEHDASYKQQEPAPRYHARDVALVMGQFHSAKVLLGSATPSLESYYQSALGKYQWVALTERFGDASLPDIVLADLISERKMKTNKGSFSGLLLREIAERVRKKEQVILFQNRRGYAPVVQCEDCDWVPKCINCSVSLTYHQYRHAMVCHYCGYREDLPKQCPTCSSKRILTVGYGTEKIEEDMALQFPDATVGRMDFDTTRTKTGYEEIIDGFETGKTDILVGTQMVTKGLDFDKVTLVGIFDADRMMHFPDFRSYERAFQLITQVSGRAGRRTQKGKVIVQTHNPKHEIFSCALRHDYLGFLEVQLHDRETHRYPPFARLIEITLKQTEKPTVTNAAQKLATILKENMQGVRIMGPGEPMVSRVRNEYLMTILVKIPRNQGKLPEIKSQLERAAEKLVEEKAFRKVRVIFDVDPV